MTHIMTPAANPRELASNLGLASPTAKTMAAPMELAAPAATTKPNAKPTLPDAVMLWLQNEMKRLSE
jgi:hypothetical protein